jgi:hypothetical protein
MRKCIRVSAAFLLLTAALAGAQENDSTLTKLRRLQLPELPGSVPVMYVPSAKDRAQQYQGSLQAADVWFEEQLGVRVPIVLAVLDQKTYVKAAGPEWPMPYSDTDFTPGLIVFPSRIEDLIGPDPKSKTPGEHIAYHEAGHIFAHSLKIQSGNAFVNELVAQIFMTAYIKENRPDLKWLLPDPAPSGFKDAPRYSSLADLDYIYMGVGFQNYVWFQYQLQRVAHFLVIGQKFPIVIQKLRHEFPSDTQKQETIQQIVAHLDKVRPGVGEILGPLAEPTTLPSLRPSACSKQALQATTKSVIAIRNDSDRPLALAPPEGATRTIAAGAWDTFELISGQSLKLPDGTCLLAGDAPSLAVIDKQ